MFFGRLNDKTFLIRLEKGELLIESIKNFCSENKIFNAYISAIGSIEDPTLAHYTVRSKKYSEKALKGIFEVTNLIGNVAVFENKPLLHCHITLSDQNMNSFGGHIVEGIVSATVEVFLTSFETHFEKKYSEEIGLKLFDFKDKH